MKKINLKKVMPLILLLISAFLFGRGIAYVKYEKIDTWATPASGNSVSVENWGLGFGAEGSQPTGNASAEELKKYNAYYVGDNKEKVIYLTFDAGYENGNTEPILDALKKHNVSATFFVVGHYLESAPEIVKRMVDEGHFVGNHTYHHLDMSSISSKESFEKEMKDVENKFKEITGQELAHFYRPPQGFVEINYLEDGRYVLEQNYMLQTDKEDDDYNADQEIYLKVFPHIMMTLSDIFEGVF